MHTNEPSLTRPSFTLPAVFRISALAILAGASTLALHAQVAAAPQPGSQLLAALSTPPPSLAAVAGVTYSSSSAEDTPTDPIAAERFNLSTDPVTGLQPPPRRRYGRPRYNDSSHNPDGSSKYEFVLGAGFTGPIGNTYHYLNTSYGIQVGGGRDFNKNFGVLLQFDYDRFGFNGRTLGNEAALYNYCPTGNCSTLSSLDGNTHIWSFSVDPHYNFVQGQSWGAYMVSGVGFFHKVANFTTPETGEAYSPYYGYYQYTANEVIDHYSSNAPGFNGGFGLTYKPSRFAGERLFVEGRYNLTLNSQRYGLTSSNINTTKGQAYYYANGSDYYPANSNRTTWLAYKAGIRF